MPFAEYDYSQFPIVHVKMNKSILNEADFEAFKAGWMHCYTYNQDWTFVFDTANIGPISLKYAMKTASFIKKLKKKLPEDQFLKKSIIYVSNKTVDYLLKIVFNLTSPVAPVYLVYSNEPEYLSSVLHLIDNREPIPKPIKRYMPS